MKHIQMLKLWAEDQQENAHKKELHYEITGDYHRYLTMSSRRSAFSEMLRELNLLLNEQPEAITEDSHFANTNVGRSAASEEITTVKNDPGESSSETQAVGQNEQTKKPCPVCDGKGTLKGRIGEWHTPIRICKMCGGTGKALDASAPGIVS